MERTQELCGLISYVASVRTPVRMHGRVQSRRHISEALKGTQEGHQVGFFAPDSRRCCGCHFAQGESLGLCFQVDFRIDMGGIEGNVTEPRADGIDIDASL